jgi:ornithine carbamoyltransferase
VTPPYALKNRSLLSLDELSARDVGLLLELAGTLKRDHAEGREQQLLRGLHIATLAAADAAPRSDPLERAAAQQGALVVRLGAHPARQIGDGNPRELPALLGRLYDAIEVKGMPRARLRDFAGRCSVPVYRDLDHFTHPARVVADLLTMQEQAAKPLGQIAVAWLGDPRGEPAETFLKAALLMGLDLRIAASRACWPIEADLARLHETAQQHGAHLSLHEVPAAALEGCDFCYGDRHAMPLRSARAVPRLQRVNGRGRAPALPDAAQENRLHAIKAMLVATLA